ncbi:MAG: DUF2325 domain-containing protein [Lachnospiraceae bacterium]|nr:DUF2325 domain-containing protein [Lachnospiraceae bacterium]
MKNVNFPLGGLQDIDVLNNPLQNMVESSGNFVNYLMKFHDDKKLMPDFNEMTPDAYGCERFFVDFFINDEMREDFPLIARDFYTHEFANIPEHQDVEYFDIQSGEDWPELVFNRFTLGLMMNAVNSGSEYTKALFLYLHKTYYKKEYRIIKRFSTMSLSELLALAKPEGRRCPYYANLSRILFIASLYGIKIDVECNVVYRILDEFSNQFGFSGGFSFDEAAGDSYKECRKEIDEHFNQKKLYSLDAKMSKFLGNVFQWLGYSPEYADWCDENDRGLEDRLAIALSILKKTFPKSNREYSAEELTLYGTILHCASAMTCNSSWLAETLKTLAYGESGTFYYDEFPPMFHPEDVQVKAGRLGNVKEERQVKEYAESAGTNGCRHEDSVLYAEVDKLRRKIHKLESDNSSLRASLAEKRRIEEDSKDIRKLLEASNHELAVLRNYVYSLTESDSPITDKTIESMKETIANYRIVIVGGHSNWLSKMKKEFPDWIFVNPKASGSTDVSIVDKADYVYFFTDTISHSKYYQFMNVIRERKINFGYIHGVNIEKNIRDIYVDFEED